MHEASIASLRPKPPPQLALTSFIYRIFGGRMRSQVGWKPLAGVGSPGGGAATRTCAAGGEHEQQRCGPVGADTRACPPPAAPLQVKCTECGYESNTFDPCIDLSLEISHANTLVKALERFTQREPGRSAATALLSGGMQCRPLLTRRFCPDQRVVTRLAAHAACHPSPAQFLPSTLCISVHHTVLHPGTNQLHNELPRLAGEVLDGGNKYKCPKQQRPVRAVKRMTVDAAPNVLMVQLKRFEFCFSGHKIGKRVEYGPSLDMSPFMSRRPARRGWGSRAARPLHARARFRCAADSAARTSGPRIPEPLAEP